MTVITDRPAFTGREVTPEEIEALEARQAAEIAQIDALKADKAYFKRRRTTYGLTKRDLALRHVREHPEYRRGMGQTRLDLRGGFPYGPERPNRNYNLGYRTAWDEGVGKLQSWRPLPTHDAMTREEIEAAREACIRNEAAHAEQREEAETARRAELVPVPAPGYSASFVAGVKRIPGRVWDADRKLWLVPADHLARAEKLVTRCFPGSRPAAGGAS